MDGKIIKHEIFKNMIKDQKYIDLNFEELKYHVIYQKYKNKIN